MMPHFKQASSRVLKGTDTALRAVLSVAFEQQRRLTVDEIEHHGVAILRFVSRRPIVRWEKHVNIGAAKVEGISLPVADDLNSIGLRD